MLLFLVTLIALISAFPKKAARLQDARIVIAYTSLLAVSLTLSVLFATGNMHILTVLLQKTMNTITREGE